MKLGIIDLDIANIGSLESAFNKLNIKYKICKSEKDLININKVILPGVGSFKAFMKKVKDNDLEKKIKEMNINNCSILGICLGFQILFNKSSEHGISQGLKLIEGQVNNFKEVDKNIQTPHVGWNSCKFNLPSKLFENVLDNSDFYFTHSYFASKIDKKFVISRTFYDFNFVSAVQKKNLYGVQFHPEKSQSAGLKLLKNFVDFC